jgi:predicted  nucleic acid-binding Zn-ribbon protein
MSNSAHKNIAVAYATAVGEAEAANQAAEEALKELHEIRAKWQAARDRLRNARVTQELQWRELQKRHNLTVPPATPGEG